MKRLTLMFVLVLLPFAATQAADAPPAAPVTKPATATDKPADTAKAPTPVSLDDKRVPKIDKPGSVSTEAFVPSEQISADKSVAFPTDI
ncbi:MAG TPA: hypothetical protein VMH83_07160 [Candidatus Acidoferrum sp.]|nr:hypothetical protein [Candidatus Acidoferrum sp.]